MKPNRFPGQCCECKARVPVNAGTLAKRPDRWVHVCAAPLCRQLVYGLEPVTDPRKLLADGTIALPHSGPDTPLLNAIAEWDQSAGVWRCTKDPGDRGLVVALCVRMGLKLSEFAIAPITEYDAAPRARALATCGGRLYQVEGTSWLALHTHALLADDMGLGKSKQMIDALRPDHGVLIVAPAVAKGVWRKEIAKWAPERFDSVIVCSGWGSFHYPRHARECVIVNPDLLPPQESELRNAAKLIKTIELERAEYLASRSVTDPTDAVWYDSHARLMGAWRALYRLRNQGLGTVEGSKLTTARAILRGTPTIRRPKPASGCVKAPLTTIFDEAHMLKSNQALRTKRCRSITHYSDRVYGLTGTPIENHPLELWGVLTSLGCRPPQWRDRPHPTKPDKKVSGWFAMLDAFGARRKPHGGFEFELDDAGAIIVKPGTTELLRRVMLRRTKADVGQQLPPVTFGEWPVELDEKLLAELDAIEPEVRAYLDRDEVPDITAYSRVRKAMATAHIPAMLEIVKQHEESCTPLLVLSDHVAPIKRLAKRKSCFTITGETPANKRTEYVDAYQSGERLIFGGTLKSMGVSITLTRAAHVLIVDPALTPSKNEQGYKRTDRIGQTQNVHVTWMYSDHALAKSINDMLIRKSTLVARTLHGNYDPREPPPSPAT